ncbi:hypothetical protein D9M71_830850 [compost metagenome]
MRQQLYEGFTHLRTNFKGLRADSRAEPDQYFGRWHGQTVEGGLQHARRQPAPTGMSRCDTGAGTVAKQHWQTVGRHRRAGDARR